MLGDRQKQTSAKDKGCEFCATLTNGLLTSITILPRAGLISPTTFPSAGFPIVRVPFSDPGTFTDLQSLISNALQGQTLKGQRVVSGDASSGLRTIVFSGTACLNSTGAVTVDATGAGTSSLLSFPVTGLTALLQGSLNVDPQDCRRHTFVNATVCAAIEVVISTAPSATAATASSITLSPIIFTGSQCLSCSCASIEKPLLFNIPVNTDASELTVIPVPALPTSPVGLPVGTLLFLRARLTLSGQVQLANCFEKCKE